MEFNQSKPIVIGFVGHIDPRFIESFQDYIRSYQNIRIIKFFTSDKKLWIIEQREGETDGYKD
jgi:hypothetical protein